MQIGMCIRRAIIARNPPALNDDFLFHVRTPSRKVIDFVACDLVGTAIEGKYCEDGRWHAKAATVNAVDIGLRAAPTFHPCAPEAND
jgi:hypothetical protein